MSRFAFTYEDPTYEREEEDIMDWLNNEIDGEPTLASVLDSWARQSVAEKQQQEVYYGA